MPPPVATLLTLGFIVFLFQARHSGKARCQRRALASAYLAGDRLLKSRFRMAQHLRLARERRRLQWKREVRWTRGFYFGLIMVGFCVLVKRQVRLSEVVSNNGWLIVFLLYCFISIAWSDFPFVAFKRWIKILGHPIMALIVLTEPDPKEAVIRLMKRCAYVVVPVSILFIKYYPELGRGFEPVGRRR